MSTAEIYDAVLEYDEELVPELIEAGLEDGADVRDLLNEGLIAALDEIGRRFSAGTLFIPEMLMAAEAVQAGLGVLRPLLVNTGAKPAGTVVIGTVKGDLHDIGKNLVVMMLEGAGFRVVDLGTDVNPEDFITAAQEHEADVVAMSGLLTTSMPEMKNAVEAMNEAKRTRNVSAMVIIGGPPINEEFATRIGADGYGIDAPTAVAVVRELVGA